MHISPPTPRERLFLPRWAPESALCVSSIGDTQKLKITPKSFPALQGLKKPPNNQLLLCDCSKLSIPRDILGYFVAQHKSTLGCCCFKPGLGINPGIQHKLSEFWGHFGEMPWNSGAPCRVWPTQDFPDLSQQRPWVWSWWKLSRAAAPPSLAPFLGLVQVGKGLKSRQGEEDGDEKLLF